MGADYSFYVKSMATYAPAFLGYNNSVLAKVCSALQLPETRTFLTSCSEINPIQLAQQEFHRKSIEMFGFFLSDSNGLKWLMFIA